MRSALGILFLLLAGCSSLPSRGPFPLPSDPKPTLLPTYLDCWWAAEQSAYILGGDVYEIAPTGSMEPTLTAKDFIVVTPAPFSDYIPYRIAAYVADWRAVSADRVIHRIVLRDSDGLIMWGDNNAVAETAYRVTELTAHGLLVEIYRVSKP